MLKFKNILVAVDAKQDHQPVLAHAVKFAMAQQAALTVVDVVPGFSWPQRLLIGGTEHLRDLLAREKSEQLKKLVAGISKQDLEVKTKVLVGRSSVELIRQVQRGQHDLVIRAAKGEHSRRASFFGTTSFELLRKCPCAVWLFKPGPISIDRILASVDATPDDEQHAQLNQRILAAMQTVAQFERAAMHIVHAWSIYGERLVRDYMKTHEFAELEKSLSDESRSALAALANTIGLSEAANQVHLLRGEPQTEIPRFVREQQIDLVVMGTVARSGIEGLLMGNTAEAILNQVQCSVLALKPADFVSPVTS